MLLSERVVLADEIENTKETMSLLTSGDPSNQCQVLEKIKGTPINEEMYRQIEKILVEGNSIGEVRLSSEILGKDRSISPDRKTGTLLKALKKQIDHPDLSYEKETYAPKSETFKRQYILAIEQIGPAAIPILKEQLKTAKDGYKSYIYIILGNLKDPAGYKQICDILKNSNDGWLRAVAARSLGLLGNKEAIPLLKEALNDSFVVNKTSDVIGPTGSDMNIAYLRRLKHRLHFFER